MINRSGNLGGDSLILAIDIDGWFRPIVSIVFLDAGTSLLGDEGKINPSDIAALLLSSLIIEYPELHPQTREL